MAKRRDVAVWLHDEWARLTVGGALQATDRPSRWVTQGVIVQEAAVGLWLKADTIQEFRPLDTGGMKKHKDWIFKSSQLLIPWGAIVTIQVFEEGDIEIGFKPSAD